MRIRISPPPPSRAASRTNAGSGRHTPNAPQLVAGNLPQSQGPPFRGRRLRPSVPGQRPPPSPLGQSPLIGPALAPTRLPFVAIGGQASESDRPLTVEPPLIPAPARGVGRISATIGRATSRSDRRWAPAACRRLRVGAGWLGVSD